MSAFGEYEFDDYKLYVLALNEGKFYVGITKEIERRLAEHKSGIGARYTSYYKPIGVVYRQNLKTRYKKEAERQEHILTIQLMKKYGVDRVRGAEYCQISTDKVIQAMAPSLYKSIVKANHNHSSAKSFKKIDQKLEKLLCQSKETQTRSGPSKPKGHLKQDNGTQEGKQKKKKRHKKSKADFWWEQSTETMVRESPAEKNQRRIEELLKELRKKK